MTVPTFGEWFENRLASDDNPTKRGMFVRSGHTPHGRMNPGPWWELTDGHGEFWRTRPENLEALERCVCHVTEPDSFGNRDLTESEDCPIHGSVAAPKGSASDA